MKPADFVGPQLAPQDFIVLQQLAANLRELRGPPADADQWQRYINNDTLANILRGPVLDYYGRLSIEKCRQIEARLARRGEELKFARLASQADMKKLIDEEACIAGALRLLAEHSRVADLAKIFYMRLDADPKRDFFAALDQKVDFEDPYLTFDPKKDVKDVGLSPLGVVHLYRQYFFELDTFLGTPTAHVWLSPGSTVELVEVSTRRTLVERTVEQSSETSVKTEKSTTDQDEISEAVKRDNKDDLKLGVTTTVNQSWGTGNISATASLNMDKTQSVAREQTHKKMRQQTEKLSTEIKQNYKSTMRTVVETTDLSSKRYVLTNTSGKLINYEMRRKMRQVGVQVQDIGSYLCWETFVDDPGADLQLASLVHVAQPADLLPVPERAGASYPVDKFLPFQTSVVWNFGDQRQHNPFTVVGSCNPQTPPDGFELVQETGIIPLTQVSAAGEDFTGVWGFGARFKSPTELEIGVLVGGSGIEWDERIDFVVSGTVRYTPTVAAKQAIDAANAAKNAAADAATAENDRKLKDAYITAVKNRVELAASIDKRKYEDLREEERIIVYRRLIASLMTSFHYADADAHMRHVLSELINSIFDVDKMLYFVAPEWWRPHGQAKPFASVNDVLSRVSDSLVAWSDNVPRPGNYLITDKSLPAMMGSSLGWLLQLDGDNLRNAYLNAPWVKAVIPVRPGKEQAAIKWLQNVGVEGADGLDAAYAAPEDELQEIRGKLELAAGQAVTILDAINYLCIQVAEKHDESNRVKTYPDTEIDDSNKVSATPIEKVYEHGFYPLQGGFRMNPRDADPDPNNKDRNFQVFDQWVEILPTDQIVPVEVTYDSKTGRQI